jgi:flagellar biosynthetic protein FliP
MSADGEGTETWSVNVQILALMTGLTLLPAAVLTMTSFTRIAIVLALLRQALGTQQTPSNQVLIGLALFLSVFVMSPVLDRIYSDAVLPYMGEAIGFQEAIQRGRAPLEKFMLAQTRDKDLNTFAQLSGHTEFEDEESVPFSVLVPSFITSELKTAFEIGFLLFIPFLIIDLVVASVLMAMGMMMLSPLVISFPFKIMLFVLIDGWNLLVGSVASSFYVSG